MKRIFLLVLVFVLCFSCFGQEKLKSDLDVGLVYGHGTAYYDEYSNGIKIKNLNANGFGVFLGGVAKSEISNGRYKQSKSDSFSRNIIFIRPQVGLTVHFDK